VILLDIEGTTTPIAFVTETLVPYARAHLHTYLERHAASPHGAALIEALWRECEATDGVRDPLEAPAANRPLAEIEACVTRLMEQDRKSTALKELQGHIWEQGYRSGELVAPVYPDVAPAFVRWRRGGHRLGIFSSGSVLAQQWLFRCTTAGDLTPHLHAYWDTHTGAKREPASYLRIASNAETPPGDIVFISDVAAELDAARAAGMRTVLADRPGNAPQPPHDHPVVRSFDEVSL
jgi:enolase-phosphatase E1